jgi:hypothetical protein
MTENDLSSRVIAVADWGRVFARAFVGAVGHQTRPAVARAYRSSASQKLLPP